ncbi:MAG TPA: VOC family protein [Thermoleophilaceae bacterium]
MRTNHVFAGIAVGDLTVARAWYERLFGRGPDLIPNDSEVAWQLNDSGWVYVVEDAERSGTALLTLLVDDLETVHGTLSERGIEVGSIEKIPGAAVQRMVLVDPDGNRITLGEPVAAPEA